MQQCERSERSQANCFPFVWEMFLQEVSLEPSATCAAELRQVKVQPAAAGEAARRVATTMALIFILVGLEKSRGGSSVSE